MKLGPNLWLHTKTSSKRIKVPEGLKFCNSPQAPLPAAAVLGGHLMALASPVFASVFPISTFTNGFLPVFGDSDPATWSQTPASLHNPFSPRVSATTNGLFWDLMAPSLAFYSWLLHAFKTSTNWDTAQIWLQHGMEPWAPLDHSFCMLTLRKFFNTISPQLCWSVLNHSWFLSPHWPIPMVPEKEVEFLLSWVSC